MKIIKGFEGETLEVSDFGEWVGKDYIDYKFEYENNQKVIKELFKENQKQKEIIDKIKEWEQNHTILVYTKKAPRQLVGIYELLHLLYDEEVE